MFDINTNVKVPKGDYCNKCKFRTTAFNLYYEPECILFEETLKTEFRDKYIKCDECKQKCIESMDDWDDCCEE